MDLTDGSFEESPIESVEVRLRGDFRAKLTGLAKPSVAAVPLAVQMCCGKLAVVGSAMLCTSVPVTVYSSRNTAVAELASAAAPSPTRRPVNQQACSRMRPWI